MSDDVRSCALSTPTATTRKRPMAWTTSGRAPNATRGRSCTAAAKRATMMTSATAADHLTMSR